MLRDSPIVKPTNFYAITSYMITKVNYQSTDLEANSKSTFEALGGTGRVGLGYQKPDSSYGGFALVDLSGFIINGQNFNFASVELHGTDKLELGQKGVLLLGAGLYSENSPIVKGTPEFGFLSIWKNSPNRPACWPHLLAPAQRSLRNSVQWPSVLLAMEALPTVKKSTIPFPCKRECSAWLPSQQILDGLRRLRLSS